MGSHGPISGLSESIIKALLYYDLFDYALTSDEVFRNLPTNHVSPRDVESELSMLVNESILFKHGQYYSLQSNPALEARRVNGGKLAAKHLEIAAGKAKLIAMFPFVRSVMISGSLSKGYADARSDIDFFVITKSGRLWIARTLLAVFRRLFLFNSSKYFCVNYFIDEDHLEIEEKNRFTATELSTLIPMRGIHHHGKLLRQNEWLLEFFPNFIAKQYPSEETKQPLLRTVIEWVINRFLPDKLDQLLMNFALRRWTKLYRKVLAPSEFELAFKSRRYVSKGHPKAYQNKVITRYEERIHAFVNSTIAEKIS